MKKICIASLLVLCTLLVSSVCFAADDPHLTQLSDTMGIDRFVQNYNQYSGQEGMGSKLVNLEKDAKSGDYFAYTADGNLEFAFHPRENGYMESIYIVVAKQNNLSSKNMHEAMMVTMAVIDGEGVPPMGMISEAANKGEAYYNANGREYAFISQGKANFLLVAIPQ